MFHSSELGEELQALKGEMSRLLNVRTDGVFDEFAGWYSGKTSPVHLFWHSLDLAVSHQGDAAGFLGHHDRHGIVLLGETDGGAMPGAEKSPANSAAVGTVVNTGGTPCLRRNASQLKNQKVLSRPS